MSEAIHDRTRRACPNEALLDVAEGIVLEWFHNLKSTVPMSLMLAVSHDPGSASDHISSYFFMSRVYGQLRFVTLRREKSTVVSALAFPWVRVVTVRLVL